MRTRLPGIGAYIATLREERGFTQQVFAAMLDISDKGLRNWEQGKSAPDVGALERILKTLHGTWAHIVILASEDATVDQGKSLAMKQVHVGGLTDEQITYIEGLNPAQLKAILAVAEQMLQ